VQRPFASDAKNVYINGEPYKFKPDSNPAVGQYDIEGGMKALLVNNPSVGIQRPSDNSPCRTLPVNKAGPDAYDC
jgi:hypothetical protein